MNSSTTWTVEPYVDVIMMSIWWWCDDPMQMSWSLFDLELFLFRNSFYLPGKCNTPKLDLHKFGIYCLILVLERFHNKLECFFVAVLGLEKKLNFVFHQKAKLLGKKTPFADIYTINKRYVCMDMYKQAHRHAQTCMNMYIKACLHTTHTYTLWQRVSYFYRLSALCRRN